MNLRRPALAAGALLFATACGPKSPVTFTMRNVSITVPRLVTPAVEFVEPAATPPPVALDPLPPIAKLLPPPPLAVPGPPAPPRPACPTAEPLDAPAEPAALLVAGPPRFGATLHAATTTYAGARVTPSAATTKGTIDVVIAGVANSTSSAGQRTQSWRVERTDRLTKARSVELYQLVHPSSDPLATASGVYLVGLAWSDPVRGDLTFQPVGNGLFILPSPVQLASGTGVQYAGSATDPLTLTTLSLARNVTGRERIDVCGVLVDTFEVEMSGTLTTPASQRQVTWTQHLATAAGSANVDETFVLTSITDGFTWTRSLRSTVAPGGVS